MKSALLRLTSLFRASSVFRLSTLGVVTTIIGVVSTVAIGMVFGVSRDIEVYFVASTLMNLMFKLFQGGQLSELFMPEYLAEKRDGGEFSARSAMSALINNTVLFGVVIVVILMTAAAPLTKLVAKSYSHEEKELATGIFVSLAPLLVVQIVNALLQMMGNAERWYGRFEGLDDSR